MEITPDQLLYLRKQRGLTREELAKELKCSAGAIVQWEGGKREIPPWVANKMFSKLPVEFTMEELNELFDICRELNCTMGELLGDSVRHLIEERRNQRIEKIQAGSGKSVEDQACADTAPSTDSSPPSPQTPPTRAKIVQLPPPPVLATLMHDTLTKAAEKTTAPPVTEQRQEVIYPKKIPRKSS